MKKKVIDSLNTDLDVSYVSTHLLTKAAQGYQRQTLPSLTSTPVAHKTV